MRTIFLIALVIVAVPDRQDPNTKSPQEELLGEWQFVKGLLLGREDLLGGKDLAYLFGNDVIRVRDNGQIMPADDRGYLIDTTQKPIAFDIIPKNGQKVLGILKLEGDQLVICYNAGPPSPTRPTEFIAPPQSMTALMYFKRAKK
jgi:uncharacterized protein (TIGR03067 family)